MGTAYLHTKPVEMKALSVMGRLLCFGSTSLHSQVYWRRPNGQCMMTELTNKPLGPSSVAIGRGHGYEVQLSEVDQLLGQPFECDLGLLECAARAYANARKGLVYGRASLHDEPQGHGGPAYGRKATCNTYASWLVASCCTGRWPEKPVGAIGWGLSPRFPAPYQGG